MTEAEKTEVGTTPQIETEEETPPTVEEPRRSPYLRLILIAAVLVVVAAGIYLAYDRIADNSSESTLSPTVAKGIDQYETYVRNDPENPYLRVQLAAWYVQGDMLSKGLDQCNVALSLSEDFQEALAAKGRIYVLQEDYDRALPPLLRIIEVNQENIWAGWNRSLVDAYYYSALSYVELGQPDEAVVQLDGMMSVAAGAPKADVLYLLGRAHRDRADWEQAINAFNEALTYDPEYAEAYEALGLAYEANGQLAEAIAAFEKAVSLNPEVCQVSAERLQEMEVA